MKIFQEKKLLKPKVYNQMIKNVKKILISESWEYTTFSTDF